MNKINPKPAYTVTELASARQHQKTGRPSCGARGRGWETGQTSSRKNSNLFGYGLNQRDRAARRFIEYQTHRKPGRNRRPGLCSQKTQTLAREMSGRHEDRQSLAHLRRYANAAYNGYHGSGAVAAWLADRCLQGGFYAWLCTARHRIPAALMRHRIRSRCTPKGHVHACYASISPSESR